MESTIFQSRRDDAIVAQVLYGDTGAFCQRAVLRDDCDEWLFADGIESHSADGQCADHEQRVDFPLRETSNLLLGRQFRDFEFVVGMLRGKHADDGGQQDKLSNWSAADAQTKTIVQTAEALSCSVYGIDNTLGVLAEGEACVGKSNLLAVALEEFDVECVFKGFDLEGNGGLTGVECTGRLAVVQQVGER